MAKFSENSHRRLDECHPDLIRLFNEVIKHVDCSILCGHRGEADQQEAYLSGKSKLQWPKSKHNQTPSLAVDVMPYPIDWFDNPRILHFVGFVRGMAKAMDIPIRSGADWNGNFDLKDKNFYDLPHFELTGD